MSKINGWGKVNKDKKSATSNKKGWGVAKESSDSDFNWDDPSPSKPDLKYDPNIMRGVPLQEAQASQQTGQFPFTGGSDIPQVIPITQGEVYEDPEEAARLRNMDDVEKAPQIDLWGKWTIDDLSDDWEIYPHMYGGGISISEIESNGKFKLYGTQEDSGFKKNKNKNWTSKKNGW